MLGRDVHDGSHAIPKPEPPSAHGTSVAEVALRFRFRVQCFKSGNRSHAPMRAHLGWLGHLPRAASSIGFRTYSSSVMAVLIRADCARMAVLVVAGLGSMQGAEFIGPVCRRRTRTDMIRSACSDHRGPLSTAGHGRRLATELTQSRMLRSYLVRIAWDNYVAWYEDSAVRGQRFARRNPLVVRPA
jgi:hypothetical protein